MDDKIILITLGFIIGLTSGVCATIGILIVISASMLSSRISQDQERMERGGE